MLKSMEDVLHAAACVEPCKLAVAVAQDRDVLKAVCSAAKLGLVEPILVGDGNEITEIALELNLPIKDFQMIQSCDKITACNIAANLAGTGRASLLMKGFVDTSCIMRAALNRENQLRTGNQISHVLVVEIPGYEKLLYVTDSAMVIVPTLEQKAALIKNAVYVAHALGNVCPKVAVLCAIEKVNPAMPCTLDAKELAEMNRRGELMGCVVDGPLALDNAVSYVAAKHKGINSAVAGQADILLTPNIESGNLLSKSIEYFAHAKKAGIIVGANAPIVLTSRASSHYAKLYSIALGVLIAAQNRRTQV